MLAAYGSVCTHLKCPADSVKSTGASNGAQYFKCLHMIHKADCIVNCTVFLVTREKNLSKLFCGLGTFGVGTCMTGCSMHTLGL